MVFDVKLPTFVGNRFLYKIKKSKRFMSTVRCDNCGWGNPVGVTRCQKCNQPLSVAQEEQVTAPVSYCAHCGYPKMSQQDVCSNCGTGSFVQQSVNNNIADPRATQVIDFNQTPKLENVNRQVFQSSHDTRSTMRLVDEIPMEAPAAAPVVEPVAAPVPERDNFNFKATVRDVSELNLGSEPQNVPEIPQEPASASVDVQKSDELSGLKLVPADGFVAYGEICVGAGESGKVLNRGNVDGGNPSIDEGKQASIAFENGKWYIENLSSMQNTFVCKKGKVELESGDVVVIGNRRYIVQ